MNFFIRFFFMLSIVSILVLAPLRIVHAQVLYGLTYRGGSDSLGAIIKYDNSTGTLTPSHAFTTKIRGGSPTGDIIEFNGKFYGITNFGGAGNHGVLFEWDTTNHVYTTKVEFTGSTGTAMGALPRGNLSIYGGKLYGMTSSGGANNLGVIFEWDPINNIYSVLVSFTGVGGVAPGSGPLGNLTLFGGKFYGMTSAGGANDAGVIFEWDPIGNVYIKKIDLIYSTGCTPYGSMVFSGTKFYGMTFTGGADGGGVIFEWDPVTNIYTKKIDLNAANGYFPYGNLSFFSGKFYGMTLNGGSNFGVIFEWDPVTNIYLKKMDFAGTNGESPYGSLQLSGNVFYGMTSSGGSIGNNGVLFEWDPVTNLYTKKIDFSGSLGTATGAAPKGGLVFSGNKFYGMTSLGGSNQWGGLFSWEPTTNTYSNIFYFDYSTGANPEGSLVAIGSKYYGITRYGGSSDRGTIFEFDPSTNSHTLKCDFTVPGGSYPNDISIFGTKLYGLTTIGGANSKGVIFEWDPVTSVYTPKIAFTGTTGSATGASPDGNMTFLGGKFYGMTRLGGSGDKGVLFEWDPITNVYTTLVDFLGSNGANPRGGLVSVGGKLYGMTSLGGANNKGVIFEWDPILATYSLKVSFTGNSGAAIGAVPYDNLTLFGGKLYGTTSTGGSSADGVIFEWDPVSNIYSLKVDFSGISGPTPGASPRGGLTLVGGKFYGTTYWGGSNNKGVCFEWDPTINSYLKKADFTGPNGANPIQGTLLEQVCTNPILTAQPVVAHSVCAGSSIRLSVGTTTLIPGYQWQQDTGAGFVNIVGGTYSGETTDTLTISNVTGLNNVRYRCIVSETQCSTISDTVTLSVGSVPGAILAMPGTIRTADAECTDSAGWTHYYTNSPAEIVLSLKKNGNDIGTIGAGLVVSASTNSHWSDTTAAAIPYSNNYAVNPLGWKSMNRWWQVTPATEPASDVQVRFYYSQQDLEGLRVATGDMTLTHDLLKCYKINDSTLVANTDSGHVDIPAALAYDQPGYWEYTYDSLASATSWKKDSLSSGFFAEYTILKFAGSGGAGAAPGGTSAFLACTNPILTAQPVVAHSVCAGSSIRLSVGTTTLIPGYQWQQDTGAGFVNIVGGTYSGETTDTLTISNVTGLNNVRYRCIVSETQCSTISDTVTLSVGSVPGAILAMPGTIRTADAECTDSAGWTHYYTTSPAEIVLSLKKNGNDIGTIGAGLVVSASTNSHWSDTTAALIVPNNNYVINPTWRVMNRWWKVQPVNQPVNDVLVRAYYIQQDLLGLRAATGDTALTHADLKCYKINDPTSGSPYIVDPALGHVGIPAAPAYNQAGYWEYAYDTTASTTTWLQGSLSGGFYAEHIIAYFSGGGGGAGAGGTSALSSVQAGVASALIRAWPNPTRDNVNLSAKQGAEWAIADPTGRVLQFGILRTGHEQIDVSNLPAGLYILHTCGTAIRVILE